MSSLLLFLSFVSIQDTAIPPFDTFHESEGFADELKTYSVKGKRHNFTGLLEEFYRAHTEKVVRYKNSYITAPDWLAINILALGMEALEQYRLEFDHLFEKEARELLKQGEIHRCLHFIHKYILCTKAPEFALKISNILLERGEIVLSAWILNKLLKLQLLQGEQKELAMERVRSITKTLRREGRYPQTLLPTGARSSNFPSLHKLKKLPLLTEPISLSFPNQFGQRRDLFALTYFNEEESLLLHNNGSSVTIFDFEKIKSAGNHPDEEVEAKLTIKTYYGEYQRTTSLATTELPFLLGGSFQNGNLVFNRIHRITIRNNAYMSEGLSCYEIGTSGSTFTAHLKWDMTETLPSGLARSRLSFIPPYIMDEMTLYTIMVAGVPRRWMYIDQYDIYVVAIDIPTGRMKWKRLLERNRANSRGSTGIIRSESLPSLMQIDKTLYAYTPSRTLFSISKEGDLLDIATLYLTEEQREHLQRGFSPQLKWSASNTDFYIVSPADEKIFRIDLLDFSSKKIFTDVLKYKSLIRCDSAAVVYSNTSFSPGIQKSGTSYTDDFLKVSTRFALDENAGLFAAIRPGYLRGPFPRDQNGYAGKADDSLLIIDTSSLDVIASAQLGRTTHPFNISIVRGHIILSSAEKLLIFRPITPQELCSFLVEIMSDALELPY